MNVLLEAHALQWIAGIILAAFLTVCSVWLRMLHGRIQRYENSQSKTFARISALETEIRSYCNWLQRIESKLDRVIERSIDGHH